jgi:hypothetical protein
LKSILGELKLTSEQAARLGVAAGTQISPYLEACCLRASASVSYQRAEQDIAVYTGMRVSAKTQQRLVPRQPWEELEAQTQEVIVELSIDGGNVKLTSGAKDEPDWRQYKAVRINRKGESRAWFQDNEGLVATMSARSLEEVVVCLGDGHDGIWNLHAAIVPNSKQRIEILDGYHLKENLFKLSQDEVDREQVETQLWKGDVVSALNQLKDCSSDDAERFRNYLLKHQNRIPNYEYYVAENLCSVGSGAVESLVKQIDQRLQIVGGRWKAEHVPKVLAQRCAYLNGELNPTTFILSRR